MTDNIHALAQSIMDWWSRHLDDVHPNLHHYLYPTDPAFVEQARAILLDHDPEWQEPGVYERDVNHKLELARTHDEAEAGLDPMAHDVEWRVDAERMAKQRVGGNRAFRQEVMDYEKNWNR